MILVFMKELKVSPGTYSAKNAQASKTKNQNFGIMWFATGSRNLARLKFLAIRDVTRREKWIKKWSNKTVKNKAVLKTVFLILYRLTIAQNRPTSTLSHKDEPFAVYLYALNGEVYLDTWASKRWPFRNLILPSTDRCTQLTGENNKNSSTPYS